MAESSSGDGAVIELTVTSIFESGARGGEQLDVSTPGTLTSLS